MSSELRVNILRGSTANGNITIQGEGTSNLGGATMQLQQGLVKSWATTADNSSIDDSLNVSTTADTDAGRQKLALTNPYSSTTTICCTTSGQNTTTLNGSGNFNRHAQAVRGDSTSEIFLQSLSMTALIDVNISQVQATGDLA